MCQLFETVRIADGLPLNLSLHNERMNRSRKELFGFHDHLKLEDYIIVPENSKTGISRCRVIYHESVTSVEFSPYIQSGTKSFKITDGNSLVYDHKYLDRSMLISLIDKSVADDIIIIKNGRVTDTSYANIVFTDGRKWVTPDTPLLKGTMRQYLVQNSVIKEITIKTGDIFNYTHFRLINAMLGFDAPLLPVRSIL